MPLISKFVAPKQVIALPPHELMGRVSYQGYLAFLYSKGRLMLDDQGLLSNNPSFYVYCYTDNLQDHYTIAQLAVESYYVDVTVEEASLMGLGLLPWPQNEYLRIPRIRTQESLENAKLDNHITVYLESQPTSPFSLPTAITVITSEAGYTTGTDVAAPTPRWRWRSNRVAEKIATGQINLTTPTPPRTEFKLRGDNHNRGAFCFRNERDLKATTWRKGKDSRRRIRYI